MNRLINILLLVIFLMAGATAQEWGEMQFIEWYPNPPLDWPGQFNPAYCAIDSLLYFDGYARFGLLGEGIWLANFSDGQCYNAMPLPNPINLPQQPEIINAMPGISVSGDSLFFCSDRPGTYGGLDIWMSVKEDSIWSEPINLGDSVNSELDELSPHYASGINTLFFDRLEQRIGFHFGLYKSIYLGNDNWSTAERLPEIINPLEHGNYAPFYDEETNTLYFNRFDNIYRSINNNGEWTEPQILSDNVNGLWMPNINDWVATRRPWISPDGNLLFYCKEIWEYNCIDFTYFLFFSESILDIEEGDVKPINVNLKLTIFPNPSNSSFRFSIKPTALPYDLAIYNIQGQLVREYSNCTASMLTWNGYDRNNQQVSSGVYFVRVNSGKEVLTEKLLIQR